MRRYLFGDVAVAIDSRDPAWQIPRVSQKAPGRAAPSASIAKTAAVWGWDASNHDWKRGPMDLESARAEGISFFTHKATEGGDWTDPYYREGLERARRAGIPVLGCYHYLWPDPPNSIEAQIDFWMSYVEAETPWWKEVPWIWQIDAEQQGLPRAPTRHEITRAVITLKKRMASTGTTGYVIVYAPRWLYGDELGPGYDIWNSDYTGSGAPRPFRDQYQGVSDSAHGWASMSGRKPRILQFASDAVIGLQHTCDVNKFDGTLPTLIRLCDRDPATLAAAGGAERT